MENKTIVFKKKFNKLNEFKKEKAKIHSKKEKILKLEKYQNNTAMVRNLVLRGVDCFHQIWVRRISC